MPPDFCWKSGGDVGEMPTNCKGGHPHKVMALCYADCPHPDWSMDWAGTCWELCYSPYDNVLFTCYRNFFHWYFKSSHIPHSVTFFNDDAGCWDDLYKAGALCYRDCAAIGMVNCGLWACAKSDETCGSSIAEMALDVITGIAEAVEFVVTFGADAPGAEAENAARNAAKKALKKIGKDGLKKAAK